jgi:glycosyltransferase involved in cell wall biosynthesis
MTEFVFWQYCLSMHQSAFLRNLAIKNKVTLLVSKEWAEDRKELGWAKPNLDGVDVFISPDENQVKEIFRTKANAIHSFGGIDAFPFVYNALKLAIKNKVRIFIHLEPLNLSGLKGRIRIFKYWLFKLRYNQYIDALLVKGFLGRACYEKVGFPKEKIWDWAYFTENNETSDLLSTQHHKEDLPSFLFVGALIERKNIIPVLQDVIPLSSGISKFSVIGVGHLEDEVMKLAETNEKIKFLGKKSNHEVMDLMTTHDFLVLPSLFDGWGAVVNEALMAGTRVIVSNKSGAASLLLNEQRGYVFNLEGNPNFKEIFKKAIQSGPTRPEERLAIKQWASKKITGEQGAAYFLRIVKFLYGKEVSRPIAPWLKGEVVPGAVIKNV